jgi:HSP20 family protein
MRRGFTDEMDRMFRTAGATAETPLQAWAPTVDVHRCNGDLVVTAELPGLKKEEVQVEMTDNALVIEGERKQEHKEDHKGFHRFERSYGKFYRSIPLPEGARADQAKAELADGVLKISVPVMEAKPAMRQIPIGTGEGKTSAAA